MYRAHHHAGAAIKADPGNDEAHFNLGNLLVPAAARQCPKQGSKSDRNTGNRRGQKAGSSKRALFRNTTAGRKTTRACSGTRQPAPLFSLCMFRNKALYLV